MMVHCGRCRSTFDVTEADRAFYRAISPRFGDRTLEVPPPRWCPDCRKQRRLTFRNERALYHRACDRTGQPMLSIHPADAPFPVYENSAWWSDDWDPLDYGRPFDFDRPFFPQFAELQRVVPRVNLYVDNRCENSKFCNQITMCRNCYLMFACSSNEDCYYGYRVNNSKNCVDCLMTNNSELCFECVETFSSYNCRHCRKISQCTDSTFLFDCRNCISCTMCVGLRNKEYCLMNEQLSKTEYFERTRALNLGSAPALAAAERRFDELLARFPRRFAYLRNTEHVTGDNIENSRNCVAVFDGANLEDCSYCHFFQDAKDCRDINFGCDRVELCYENSTTGIDAREVLFSINTWPVVSQLLYCDSCSNGTSHCFGCIGLRKHQHCILNRQYTKDDYEALAARIIDHMRAASEWGEFFPSSCSPHAYNETVAIQYYPLTEQEADKQGFSWRPSEGHTYLPQTFQLPDTIAEVTDDVLKALLACVQCAKNFKIVMPELEFYRKQGIPLPHACSDCRHLSRAGRRNPPRLFSRPCSRCGEALQTTYAPGRPETVYCERCYLESIPA